MKIKKIKLTRKMINDFKKKYRKEIDILIFGSAFQDEKGNRIDPMNVYTKISGKNNEIVEYEYRGHKFK